MATGLAYGVILLGATGIALSVFPLLRILPGDRGLRAQAVVNACFRLCLGIAQGLGLIRFTVRDVERLRNCCGCLIVANHPTLLDVVVLMALVPRVTCIVKHELWRSPFLGGIVRGAGYLRNDGPPERLLEGARAALALGRNLIVFPEGTRTRAGALPHFRRGFAALAGHLAVDIQLVVIRCTPPVLAKGMPWWRVPATRPLLTVEATDRLEAAAMMAYEYQSIASRRLTRQFEQYYMDKLADARS